MWTGILWGMFKDFMKSRPRWFQVIALIGLGILIPAIVVVALVKNPTIWEWFTKNHEPISAIFTPLVSIAGTVITVYMALRALQSSSKLHTEQLQKAAERQREEFQELRDRQTSQIHRDFEMQRLRDIEDAYVEVTARFYPIMESCNYLLYAIQKLDALKTSRDNLRTELLPRAISDLGAEHATVAAIQAELQECERAQNSINTEIQQFAFELSRAKYNLATAANRVSMLDSKPERRTPHASLMKTIFEYPLPLTECEKNGRKFDFLAISMELSTRHALIVIEISRLIDVVKHTVHVEKNDILNTAK